MSSDELVFTIEDGIATIRLNRPERLNAFTPAMLDAWAEAIEAAKRDERVRVVVLTGTGRGFCSGGDVRAMGERHQGGETAFQRKTAVHERIHRIPRLLEDFDKPYIVAINGIATGAGLDMALMGDIRFAARARAWPRPISGWDSSPATAAPGSCRGSSACPRRWSSRDRRVHRRRRGRAHRPRQQGGARRRADGPHLCLRPQARGAAGATLRLMKRRSMPGSGWICAARSTWCRRTWG